MLNIAEVSSRFSNKDRKNFMVVARGSTVECALIVEYLYEVSEIEEVIYNKYIFYDVYLKSYTAEIFKEN
jgi:four helix bundle protein